MKIINHSAEGYKEALIKAIKDQDLKLLKVLKESNGQGIIVVESFLDLMKLAPEDKLAKNNHYCILSDNASQEFVDWLCKYSKF